MANVLKRAFLLLSIVIIVLGCASKPKPIKHAYRITDVPQEIIIKIAHDAVAQMSILFAPARTRIALTHSASDQFGMTLIDELRKQGFFVKAHTPPQTLDQVLADHHTHQHQSNELKVEKVVDKNGLIKLEEPDSAVPLSYLLDHTRDSHFITMTVGNLKLIRSYAMEGRELRPTEHWEYRKP